MIQSAVKNPDTVREVEAINTYVESTPVVEETAVETVVEEVAETTEEVAETVAE